VKQEALVGWRSSPLLSGVSKAHLHRHPQLCPGVSGAGVLSLNFRLTAGFAPVGRSQCRQLMQAQSEDVRKDCGVQQMSLRRFHWQIEAGIMVEWEATEKFKAEVDFNATWIGETNCLAVVHAAARNISRGFMTG
jgi:hypothetical protein